MRVAGAAPLESVLGADLRSCRGEIFTEELPASRIAGSAVSSGFFRASGAHVVDEIGVWPASFLCRGFGRHPGAVPSALASRFRFTRGARQPPLTASRSTTGLGLAVLCFPEPKPTCCSHCTSTEPTSASPNTNAAQQHQCGGGQCYGAETLAALHALQPGAQLLARSTEALQGIVGHRQLIGFEFLPPFDETLVQCGDLLIRDPCPREQALFSKCNGWEETGGGCTAGQAMWCRLGSWG